MASSTPTLDESITAISKNVPPEADPITYLTIVEAHLSFHPELLSTLNDLLQDQELTQSIGWDLIQILLPYGEKSEQCLNTIARLGNPREVVLKVTEAMTLLDLDEEHDEEATKDIAEEAAQMEEAGQIEKLEKDPMMPASVDRFCTLVNLLAILHPRIKTKYPSRFLSTSLIAILTAFRPSAQATRAVLAFVHTVSGKKRPTLPGRKSTVAIPTITPTSAEPSAPDPEATSEDPKEAGIQNKLLQSFVTHILEEYINSNGLEWSARLQEFYEPRKIVANKKSAGEAYKTEEPLQEREIIVGQLVALSRDLGLGDYDELFDAIYAAKDHPLEYDTEDSSPSSPADIPLSQAGSLYLIVCLVFSSILFTTKTPKPKMSIFKDHLKLVDHFIGAAGPQSIGQEEESVIDALVFLGLWLENTDAFVSGPLSDEEYLQHLQNLSLLSANCPSPSLRYQAHILTSAILHAHPVDRIRLAFITDTLENCPFSNLKVSAVSWLKDEVITAHQRQATNLFSTSVAISATQPYLFNDLTSLAEAPMAEQREELSREYGFHMAVVNFLVFISGEIHKTIVPDGMWSVVEEIYTGPLRKIQENILREDVTDGAALVGRGEMEILGQRLDMLDE